ncbi:MAG TPA: FlgD immunoglobulin-like domain containing protein, partial [Actinomycetota bacterium]|nr:FlgD immunoglobulin-like domain containing protein [Actinomycetota bacterium]
KDTTRITYDLREASNPVVIRIYEAESGGGCCGSLVREVTQFVNRVAGTYSYVWNGRDDGGGVQPEGDYWVQITATAYTGIDGASVPVQVSLDRYFRVTGTKTQNGIAFHHKSATTVLRSGGSCAVTKDTGTRDARIRCRNARVRVFWRWTLPSGPRISEAEITGVSFVLIRVSGYTCGATMGHTGNDSYLQVGAVGHRRCRVDKARITFSYRRES